MFGDAAVEGAVDFDSNIAAVDELSTNEAIENAAAVDGCSNLEVMDKFVGSAPVGDAAVEGDVDCGSNIAAVDELAANEAVKNAAVVDGCSNLEVIYKFVDSAPVGDVAVGGGVD